ncbi:MAG TPA: hypothetical protein VKU37_02895 [Verrucomicrobiae bacterium]|nr:hypothetical protein [Verrucomicrobiae bacterium]
MVIFGFLAALLVAGCARKKLVTGIYTCQQGDLSAKYVFLPNGTVEYTSNLNGQFYHTKTGNGVYMIQENQVLVSMHGMMDFTSPFDFLAAFKMDKNNLVQLYTVDANGQTNREHQDLYVGPH